MAGFVSKGSKVSVLVTAEDEVDGLWGGGLLKEDEIDIEELALSLVLVL